MLGDIQLSYPLILAALPLLLLFRLLRRVYSNRIGILAPTILLNKQNFTIQSGIRRFITEGIHLGFLIAVTLGAARPVSINIIAPEATERRNLILALDLSRSMDARDFRTPNGIISRIDGVKAVTAEFVKKRIIDRIGIVVFGTTSFLQAPLTIDQQLLVSLVEQLRTGIAGDGTAIGDGLGLALKRIKDQPSESKAIILLTDGVSNSGQVEPLKAANIAKDMGVKVYTIGIGSRDGGFINLGQGILSQRVRAEFDEESLKQISDLTGGKYYYAGDSEGLEKIYNEIDKLEKTEAEDQIFERTTEYYPYLALIAAALFCIHFILSQTIFKALP